jgi:RNA polymerase sigma factor (TIGR02999 family)
MTDPLLGPSPSSLPTSPTVTELLGRWSDGDREAAERLMEAVYDQLRSLAHRCFQGERQDHTLQPTAVLHEVVIDLLERQDLSWQNRSHFFGLAACMMRRALVDHARERAAQKRGGDLRKVPLEGDRPDVPRPRELLALDEALKDLEEVDRRKALIVELRFFGGLTVEDVGRCLGVSSRTIAREWRRARAHLYRQLSSEVRDAF